MRKVLVAAAAAVVLAACQKVELADEPNGGGNSEEPTKAFTFHLKGDFSTAYEDMTRAAVRLENDNTAGVTDVWVLDYSPLPTSPDGEGVLVQSVHQHVGDNGFGSVPMSLTYGHHDIKLIAAKGADPALTASALSWGRVKDTFVLDYPVDVVASSNGNRAPELKRAVSGVKLVVTDVAPANAKEITVEYERSQSLALPSLVAGAAAVSGVTNSVPDGWKSATTEEKAFSVYTLCPTDEMTTDVHVKVVATDGSVISDFTIEDVSLKKNRMTVLTGECFGRGSGFSVAIDDTWDEPLNSTF